MGLSTLLPFIILLFLCIANTGYGAEDCINNASPQNSKLITSFNQNHDPLKNEFIAACNNLKAPEKMLCIQDINKKQFGMIQVLANQIKPSFPKPLLQKDSETEFPAPFIDKECIAASMKRSPGNKGFTCDYPTEKEKKQGYSSDTQSVPHKYGIAGGKSLQCVNQDLVDYMHFAVNSAIQCMSPQNPIDSRVIFQKLNNETGFNHTLAYSGGVGAMQATTSAVKEMTSPLGKGKYVLDNIANSSKKSCQGFKDLAHKDLVTPPNTRSANYCSWVNSGDGLARSLMYGIGYYITMRDQYVTPFVAKRSASLAQNKDVINKLTAISYGSEGIKHSRWLLRKFRVSNKTNPTKLANDIKNNSIYLKAMDAKMRESLCLKNGLNASSKACKKLKLTQEELGGDQCVSQ